MKAAQDDATQRAVQGARRPAGGEAELGPI